MTVTLYHFGRSWGLPDLSPFCLKLELTLRVCGIEYERVADPRVIRKAPNKKMPFIEHDKNLVSDSQVVLNYIKETFGKDLDAQLTESQVRLGTLIQRTCENHLYWILVYSRWADETNWPVFSERVFRMIPAVFRGIVSKSIRKKTLKQLYAEGTLRYPQEWLYQEAERDVVALMDQIGDGPYLFGEQITSYDCVLFANLAEFYFAPVPNNPIKKVIENHSAGKRYCETMMSKWFGDLQP